MATDERIVQRWLERGQKFFGAMTRNGAIRAGLQARGLTRSVLLEGWRLYSNVLGFDQREPEPQEAVDLTAADAEAQIDAWDAPNYSAITAVIAHRSAEVHRYLFNGVAAARGPQAVAGVSRLLDQFQVLAQDKADDVDPEAAAEAVSLLRVRRLLDEETVTRLRRLIDKAKSGAAPVPAQNTRSEADFEADFKRFRDWIHEWREVARTTFTRRDYLIMLGLASRRTRRNETNNQTDVVVDDDEDDDDNE